MSAHPFCPSVPARKIESRHGQRLEPLAQLLRRLTPKSVSFPFLLGVFYLSHSEGLAAAIVSGDALLLLSPRSRWHAGLLSTVKIQKHLLLISTRKSSLKRRQRLLLVPAVLLCRWICPLHQAQVWLLSPSCCDRSALYSPPAPDGVLARAPDLSLELDYLLRNASSCCVRLLEFQGSVDVAPLMLADNYLEGELEW